MTTLLIFFLIGYLTIADTYSLLAKDHNSVRLQVTPESPLNSYMGVQDDQAKFMFGYRLMNKK